MTEKTLVTTAQAVAELRVSRGRIESVIRRFGIAEAGRDASTGRAQYDLSEIAAGHAATTWRRERYRTKTFGGERYISTNEVAVRHGVDADTLRTRSASRHIRTQRHGNALYLHEDDCRAYLAGEEHSESATAEPDVLLRRGEVRAAVRDMAADIVTAIVEEGIADVLRRLLGALNWSGERADK